MKKTQGQGAPARCRPNPSDVIKLTAFGESLAQGEINHAAARSSKLHAEWVLRRAIEIAVLRAIERAVLREFQNARGRS